MTRIRVGFRSKRQLPLFMIWREDWEDGDVVFAQVLFLIEGPGYAAAALRARAAAETRDG